MFGNKGEGLLQACISSIIMYGAVHEFKAPFLLTLIQTLTKFAMGQSGSCTNVHHLNAHRFTIA